MILKAALRWSAKYCSTLHFYQFVCGILGHQYGWKAYNGVNRALLSFRNINQHYIIIKLKAHLMG